MTLNWLRVAKINPFQTGGILKFKTTNKHVDAKQRRYFFKRFRKSAAAKTSKVSDKDTNCEKSESGSEKKADPRRRLKVCIIGGGSVPIYTSLLLKQSSIIESIHLMDAERSQFVNSLDANHIDTLTRLKCFPKTKIIEALENVDIVALMEEMDVARSNTSCGTKLHETATYVRKVAEQLVEYNPDALVVVFVEPVTATLPMLSEIYEWAGICNPNKLIGSTALYSMRMDVTTARFLDLNPEFISVPLSGGADAVTLVPLLSRAKPFNELTNVQEDALLRSFRCTDDEIHLRDPCVPALSTAAASAKLILVVGTGLRGHHNATACAYVRSNVLSECRYFTSRLQFGLEGIDKNFGLPKISPTEVSLIDQAIPLINEYAQKGINAVRAGRRVKLKKSSDIDLPAR